MLEALGFWAAPLLLIPGKGLLTISTAAQYNQLLASVAQFGATPASSKKLPLLRRALVALYLGIVFDAFGGLMGGLLYRWSDMGLTVVVVTGCIGVVCLLAAALLLIAEISVAPATK